MSTGVISQPQTDANTNQGPRMNCPMYNCQRLYTDADSLGKHIQEHQHHMPTQSLPGKGFLCSSIGCQGSFPSMQQLMEHMRQHYKPNTYFLCESCRSRLRSYRALLKHLHTCAKVAKSKAKAGQVAEVKSDPDGAVPMATEPSGTNHEPPQEPMESESPHPADHRFSQVQRPLEEESRLTGASECQMELSTCQLLVKYSHLYQVSGILTSWSSYCGSSISGQSFNSRILWKHTRGRYSCVQCGYSTTNRKEMTAHIKGQHQSPAMAKATNNTGRHAANAIVKPLWMDPMYMWLCLVVFN
ncbi:hypothetical protein DPEC_G00053910 [Dallia pectoralis]|uniref:Uncharacterized protein n=1 Tax=Dallia pectoralis TaxID=75939 RepID=A0ACC2H5H3_DALPE|nr:hypothetical protein DPEC_G00053910 [Dallia pectoralis]